VGFSDVTRLLDSEGRLLPPSRWPKDAKAAVASMIVEEGQDGTVSKRVRMHRKTEALKTLAQATGLTRDAVNVKLGEGFHITINTYPPDNWRDDPEPPDEDQGG
jgi:hypothetical protein